MEYTILKLAKLAGISTRTLRYYDEMELLKPARLSSSGYRIYGQAEIDKLQQILFYREMGVELSEIKKIVNSPQFDYLTSLISHRQKLLAKREQLDALIDNVNKTIDTYKGGRFMSDKEKFEGFKQKLIDENEAKYGKEIREKYGDEKVNASNQQLMGLSKEQYEEFEKLGQELENTLKEAVKTGEPAGQLGQKVADLHKRWLGFTWGSYSKEAHAGLAEMYVADERFKAYYDNIVAGGAQFLRDAILVYTKK